MRICTIFSVIRSLIILFAFAATIDFSMNKSSRMNETLQFHIFSLVFEILFFRNINAKLFLCSSGRGARLGLRGRIL